MTWTAIFVKVSYHYDTSEQILKQIADILEGFSFDSGRYTGFFDQKTEVADFLYGSYGQTVEIRMERKQGHLRACFLDMDKENHPTGELPGGSRGV